MSPIINNDIKQILASGIIDWNRFSGKTVVVTGANGMIPFYIVATLLEYNKIHSKCPVHVIGIVRDEEKSKQKFCDYLTDRNFEIIVQDVSCPIQLNKSVDFIIHAASQASPKYYRVDPVGTISANVQGTDNTLKLAYNKHVEGYLFLSSSEVYGIVDSDHFPVVESDYGYIDILKVRSCYAESKRMGENLCISYHEQFGVMSKIVRIFHTYGPGLRLDDGRVFADFCKAIIQNENIVLHSNGEAMRSFCYITDAVIALLKILLDGECTAYNMANVDIEISIKKLAQLLVEMYPEKNLSVIFDLDSNSEAAIMKSPLSRLHPDCSRLYNLGWKPSVSLEDGFRKTIDNFLIQN